MLTARYELNFYARLHTCEERLLTSSCPPVCLSMRPYAWNNSPPSGRILINFDIWVFSKICPENSSFIKILQEYTHICNRARVHTITRTRVLSLSLAHTLCTCLYADCSPLDGVYSEKQESSDIWVPGSAVVLCGQSSAEQFFPQNSAGFLWSRHSSRA